jgi:HlyD family secretion protein
MKASNGRVTRQPVKVGLVSGGRAEILDGLKEGDLVVPATIAPKVGARVRARVATSPSP